MMTVKPRKMTGMTDAKGYLKCATSRRRRVAHIKVEYLP